MEEPKIIIPTKDHLFNMQEFLKLTPGNIINYTLLAIGLVITVVRFTQGIGAVSNLDDYQPWGMWIGFDLLCGVCLRRPSGRPDRLPRLRLRGCGPAVRPWSSAPSALHVLLPRHHFGAVRSRPLCGNLSHRPLY